MQQVINTIKSKHYSYNSFDAVNNGGVGTVTALNVIKHNRNTREAPAAMPADFMPGVGGLSVDAVLRAVHGLKT